MKVGGKQYGEYESLHIGDTITVYYQKNNPSNSETYVRNINNRFSLLLFLYLTLSKYGVIKINLLHNKTDG